MDDSRILEIYSHGNGDYYRIDGLEFIEPFGAVIWGNYTVYTTRSLLKKRNAYAPRYYIFTDGHHIKFKDREKGLDLCLSQFINLMSENEQLQAKRNIVKIMDVLGI